MKTAYCNYMKKTVLIICSILLICISVTFALIKNYSAYAFCPPTECQDYNELSITLLHPHIEKAIGSYYGYNRRYEIGDSQLKILERQGNVFTVEVRADTFEGAHNDYYTEILTFKISPLSVTLIKYVHSEFIQ